LDQLLEQVERRVILLALRRHQGNKSKAAEVLGIWRARLLRRMEALGIQGE
jgi:DNA-binding NtrC family response regulator